MTDPATDGGRDGPVPQATVPVGLPDGVMELAADLWLRAGGPADGAGCVLRDLLTAPIRLDRDWPRPAPPRRAGSGWVHVEVTEEDSPSLEAVMERWGDREPDALARACQEMRLPVSPYRPLPPSRPERSPGSGVVHQNKTDPAGAVVVDLSTHWAGPLTTKLLAEAGAEVIKVDPRCRPDGFGARPELYRHLNGAKEVIDLDLRSEPDRARFETLLATADLLVESYSRRVMANLGYGRAALRRLNPELSVLSVKAYPAGTPEQDWLAFGPGVHAAGGLGLIGPEARPAPLAYPDYLTGLAGYGRALALLDRSGPDPGRCDGTAEVSLLGTIQPLVDLAVAQRAGDEDGDG